MRRAPAPLRRGSCYFLGVKLKPDSKAPGTSAKGDAKAERKRDVVLVHGVSEDGKAYHVMRAREDRLEAGIVRALEDGVQGDGEVVKLTPRSDAPMLYDVDVEVPSGVINARGATKGPAQVTSQPYRANWDRIWKKGRDGGSLPN